MKDLFNNSKDDWDNLDLENYNSKLLNFTLVLGTIGIIIGIAYLIFFI